MNLIVATSFARSKDCLGAVLMDAPAVDRFHFSIALALPAMTLKGVWRQLPQAIYGSYEEVGATTRNKPYVP